MHYFFQYHSTKLNIQLWIKNKKTEFSLKYEAIAQVQRTVSEVPKEVVEEMYAFKQQSFIFYTGLGEKKTPLT